MLKARLVACLLALALAATPSLSPRPALAATAAEINRDATTALNQLFEKTPDAKKLAVRAKAILIFPSVYKAGFMFGAQYGEGALRKGNKTVGYYNTVAASFGFQLGAQARSVIIMFMTPEALAGFRRVEGFKVGVDGSVAIIVVGAGGSIDTDKVTSPVIGFILDPKGLMYNLTLEGSKITRISR